MPENSFATNQTCQCRAKDSQSTLQARINQRANIAGLRPNWAARKGNVVMPMICPTDWMVPMAVRTLAARMGAPVESVVVANWAMKPELAMRFPFIPIW
jgi:hypothetical protein